ncbi:MAG: sugar kinase [Clostridia bacterium]|nr:sugar kinase [Clostridia bacterium]
MRYVTFGEIMLRLNPEGYERFLQTDGFVATYAGAEANVAVSLANYGAEAYFVTKVPAHEIGQAAVNSLRRYGVGTQYMARGGDRLGIYFVEKGASQRASKVIYDRAHSAIAEADAADFNWDEIFKDGGWFHFTGLTPALSDSLAAICLEALKQAKAHGMTVSCDLNYRSKLWSREKAKAVMTELAKYVDVCIANEEDAADVFGIHAANTDITEGKLSHEGYKSVAKQLADTFGFKYVAFTLRESISASDNNWAAMLYDGTNFCISTKYAVHIVDRVGGGDSFGGALIYALGNGYSTQDAINFAAAASCLKHSIEGDFNLVSLKEVQTLAAGNASGRVVR